MANHQVNDQVVPLTQEQLDLLVGALSEYKDVPVQYIGRYDSNPPHASDELINLRSIVKTWRPGLTSSPQVVTDTGSESPLSEFGVGEMPLG
jgi:hypothetical protein